MTDYIKREDLLGLYDLGGLEVENAKVPLNVVIQNIKDMPSADVRPVVTCSDCKWWTKQEASLQGRCELLQMYPTGEWFCANGKREEN